MTWTVVVKVFPIDDVDSFLKVSRRLRKLAGSFWREVLSKFFESFVKVF
jgi:hypothetical protein